MFTNTMGKGFQLTFDNGNTISVQWGRGNYCENYSNDIPMESINLWGYSLESKNAEIAIWDSEGVWITKEFIPDLNDDVKGLLTADEVLKLMIEVAK
jgi:hypothetical protein